jgi:Uma2 family endonuclease
MSAVAAQAPQRHLISVENYYRMAEAGIFSPEARVELIEGEIIDMSPIGIDHAYAVTKLSTLLTRAISENAIVSAQNPITLNRRSEPQPDIVLLRYREDFYRHSRPTAHDVLLLIEVADSSLRYDREVKLPLYARHGIPEVWIVDLQRQRLEIYRRPEADGYLEKHCPTQGESISPLKLASCVLELGNLF